MNSGCWWWTGSLVCCSSWGCKESGGIERLNWAELNSKRIKNNFGSQATENPGNCGLLFIFFPRVPTLAVVFKWLSQPASLLGQALVSKWASRSRYKVWFWCVKGNGVDVCEAKRVELNSLRIFGEEWKSIRVYSFLWPPRDMPDLSSWLGWHPHPLQWKCGVLTTGPADKSQEYFWYCDLLDCWIALLRDYQRGGTGRGRGNLQLVFAVHLPFPLQMNLPY